MSDWVGNANSIFKTLGASNHTDYERESNDYYATEPKAAELLLEVEDLHTAIWECACGEGHLAEVFKRHGYTVKATDLIDRGYGLGGVDFLKENICFHGDIVTNHHTSMPENLWNTQLIPLPTATKCVCFSNFNSLRVKPERSYSKSTHRKLCMSVQAACTAL